MSASDRASSARLDAPYNGSARLSVAVAPTVDAADISSDIGIILAVRGKATVLRTEP